VLVACAFALVVRSPAAAQAPGGAGHDAPGPRVSIGGEITGTIAPSDDGYFNYTDYEYSLLRLFTATLDAGLHVGAHVEVLGELQVRNQDASASGLYVRIRPWPEGGFAIQAGRIPPVFGRFARRGYGQANPLIGVPLAYQYVTTLRPTEVPSDADALLAVRGRGWRVVYPRAIAGEDEYREEYGPGLPIVATMRWDTGAQVHYARRNWTIAAAVTNGSLSNPRLDDDNGGKQVAARATWRPAPPVEAGLSVSRGAFLARSVTEALPPTTRPGEYVQRAIALDAEISAGYWIVRAEGLVSEWALPELGSPRIVRPLRSTALTIEGRYRVRPGLHVAARGDRLLFSRLTGTVGAAVAPGTVTPPAVSLPWDAPVSRVEVGAGYALTRHVGAKIAWQYNWRDGVSRPRSREGFVAAQVSAWF
jgi:hypothetical protein